MYRCLSSSTGSLPLTSKLHGHLRSCSSPNQKRIRRFSSNRMRKLISLLFSLGLLLCATIPVFAQQTSLASATVYTADYSTSHQPQYSQMYSTHREFSSPD